MRLNLMAILHLSCSMRLPHVDNIQEYGGAIFVSITSPTPTSWAKSIAEINHTLLEDEGTFQRVLDTRNYRLM